MSGVLGFDSLFCRPGIEGAHEKGGVEGEIGRFRRRHLVPVPTVASLGALNELIAAGDRIDDDRVITGRPITIGAAFAIEAMPRIKSKANNFFITNSPSKFLSRYFGNFPPHKVIFLP